MAITRFRDEIEQKYPVFMCEIYTALTIETYKELRLILLNW